MSKAILVMDMPSRCEDCQLIDSPYDLCILKGYDISNYRCESKPDWCPLREVPQKQEEQCGETIDEVAIGYNACIDEIMKGSEE